MNDLDKLILGTKKNLRLRNRRERKTRFGLANKSRKVTSDFPIHLVGAPESAGDGCVISLENRRHKVRVAKRFLWEFVKRDRCSYRLVRDRLLDNDQIKQLAMHHGINYATARSLVARATHYVLGHLS